MSYISDFCERFALPEEAEKKLESDYQKLKNFDSEYSVFNECIAIYSQNTEFEHDPVFAKIEALTKETGIHKYTLDLLYMIMLVPELERLYTERGISEEIFFDSVCDLKWKAVECKNVYGVWGIFVGWWTIGFFKLKRFAFGRLQFNLRRFERDFEFSGISVKKGDIYIDTHIPSSGALKHEECLKAYGRAADFFKDDFDGKPIIFACRSWLLSPNNYKILPETSNVLAFMCDYEVLEVAKDESNSNLWRIFDVFSVPANPEDLPHESSLRRAFVRWLKNGNSIDTAFGAFVWEEKISEE